MNPEPVQSEADTRDLQSAFSKPLLDWYQRDHRALPWRQTRDPYAILVSEVMLQQTQVRKVIPYYERWMKRYPDADTLAEAPEDEVLKAWEGLGYYRRARLLQAAAQMIVSEHNGRFPSDVEGISSLPGVGPYTAGAVASIAFNLPRPILDGNVIRVLTRWFGIRGLPARAVVRQQLWERAAGLIPRGAAGDFNQSLMELGATVCAPRNPTCLLCPVRKGCWAFAHNAQDVLPETAPPLPVLRQFEYAGLVLRKNEVLLCRRPGGGRMERLWQFPSVLFQRPAPNWTTRWKKEYGGLQDTEKLTTLAYAVTNHRIRLEFHRILGFQRYKLPGAHWVQREETTRLAFTAAHRKLADRFLTETPSEA